MNTDDLVRSLVLMGVGMFVVFTFMGLMIAIVKIFVSLATRFFPDREAVPERGEAEPGAAEAAAAAAAVTRFRREKEGG